MLERDERLRTWDQQPEEIVEIHECKRNTCIAKEKLKIIVKFRQTISAYVMWKPELLVRTSLRQYFI